LRNIDSNENLDKCSIYSHNDEVWLEALIPKLEFKKNGFSCYSFEFSEKASRNTEVTLTATNLYLKNHFIEIDFDKKGKISSFRFNNNEFACPKFLESSISYGKETNPKQYSSENDQVIVLRDGTDGLSASVSITSEFSIENLHKVKTTKNLTLYHGIPHLFVDVKMEIPNIKGESTNIGKSDGTSYFVEEEYQEKWQEIMPCEIRSNILGISQPLKIWKRNFLGVSDYFNLDMKQVDPRNADIDCLVANISDGWMALSNSEKGLLVGFNSLKAANFAFSPLKIRDKGFGDLNHKSQQVRINPFGTYFGKLLHYWTEGSGHAQKIVAEMTGTDESTAPTFSGNSVSFNLIISPFMGENPPIFVKTFADHFSLEPLLLFKRGDDYHTNYSPYARDSEIMKNQYEIDEIMNMSYIEWVRKVNQEYKEPSSESGGGMPKLSILNMLRILIDGIKGK
jgi:hypothetical protein